MSKNDYSQRGQGQDRFKVGSTFGSNVKADLELSHVVKQWSSFILLHKLK